MKYTQVKECIREVGRDGFNDLIEQFGIDIVEEYVAGGYSIDTMEEAYQGQYRDDEEFAEELCNDIYDLGEECWHPANYIDWEGVAKDLMMDYFEIDGYYFRSL